MVSTRFTSRSREGALQKVINTGLNWESNTKYRLNFDANNIQMTMDFMLLGEDDFGAIEGLWTPPEKFTLLEKKKLVMLQKWARSQPNISLQMWYDLTKEDFESFVVSGGVPVPISVTTSSPVTSHSNNLAAEFWKGLQQSITKYTKLKEDRFWNSFQHTLLSVANSHGIKNVFDPTYKPDTYDAKDLFMEQQKFAYSV